MRTAVDRLLGLGAALAAASVLVAVSPTSGQHPAPPAPVALDVAWPHAQRGSITARLPDATAYQPGIFLDAHTSVGTAPSTDGRYLRLVVRGAGASIRQLRRLPANRHPSFSNFTRAGDLLAWVEDTSAGRRQLWSINLRQPQPARQLTADLGDAVLNGVPHDLVIAGGRLYWTAGTPQHRDTTEIRSIALAGGPTTTRVEPGQWHLSAWPWLANGAGQPAGTTALTNMTTHQTITVPGTGLHTTTCDPVWCQIVTLTRDLAPRTDLMHPDGSTRLHIPGVTVPATSDVAPLNRFEILSATGPYSNATGTSQLLIFDLATRRTVQISPAARGAAYNAGVLWWSTGPAGTSIWHTLDLRTI